MTTAAWARLVAAPGRTLFYSTVAENVSSQRVAAHLDLRLLGWRWSLIPGPWPGGDAWGRALEDFDAGVWVPTPELEVSGGEVGPAMHPEWFFRGFDQWDWWDRELIPLVVRGPVLDLGAGAGRAALWLQERGLPVTAVDSSPAAARVCAARGVADVRIGDLNEPPDDQRWRAVLLLCGNLGLGGSWSGCRRLLSRLAQITDPDAVVVADTVEPRGPADIELRIRYKGEVTAWWPQRNIAVDEIAALVDGTGWTAARHLVDVPDHAVLLRRTPTEGGERS